MLLTLALCLFSLASAVSMSAQVTIEIKNRPLTEALKMLEEQSGYSFFYSNVLPDRDAIVSVSAKGKDIRYVMDSLLAGLRVSYEIKDDNQITLSEKKETRQTVTKPVSRIISGVVTDTDGYPVIGAGVMVEGTTQGTITDEAGA